MMGNCLKGIFRSDNYSHFDDSIFEESLLEPLNNENGSDTIYRRYEKLGIQLNTIEKIVNEHNGRLEFLNQKIDIVEDNTQTNFKTISEDLNYLSSVYQGSESSLVISSNKTNNRIDSDNVVDTYNAVNIYNVVDTDNTVNTGNNINTVNTGNNINTVNAVNAVNVVDTDNTVDLEYFTNENDSENDITQIIKELPKSTELYSNYDSNNYYNTDNTNRILYTNPEETF